MSETYDLVIVGSGWYGLGAARAYILSHPDQSITVLDSNNTVGGTWSKERLYPGLKSNNMLGSYEFPDFPMDGERYGVQPMSHIPGAVLHRYLTDFSEHYRIYERLQFNSTVDAIESTSLGWTLTVKTLGGKRKLSTTKLILATGLTSTPSMPCYKGAESFGRPLFHAKDFCRRAEEVKGVEHVVVIGAAKSAYDVAYEMAKSGATIDLIVRPNGNGPVWIAPRHVTPLRYRTDTIFNMRILTWFSPCPWGSEDGYGFARRFLESTSVGKWIVRSFWSLIGHDILQQNQYDDHPELKKLKPWNSIFWTGSGLSILNYSSSFFDMVRNGKVRVHIENVERLARGQVILENGKVLDTDAVICSTGWKKESNVTFSGLGKAGLNLAADAQEQENLNLEYDAIVLAQFPLLKAQPVLRPGVKSKTAVDPLRYYRFMVPSTMVAKRNFAFAGMISSVSTSVCANAQGLWITAYFDGRLERQAEIQEDIVDGIMAHTQWGKWRYPCGYGASLPDLVFESIPYVDMLLKDVGICHQRKRSWLTELFSAYTPEDYKGILGEYRIKSCNIS
ncbi:hypothetical protein EKO04_003509 [Ascochyta lentis]|uniref:Flavin-containing monooxygenase n=1 Tax=Ascochyta lentis TaxID=205686 RepID=A0A8H7J7X0_9PLEO|nr:hypothetical protein EKO04_003509 [Ascochyta lentis]